MTRLFLATALVLVLAGSAGIAHHSYAAYETTRLVTVEGVLEEFEWVAPHSLIKVRGTDTRLYTAEWRAPSALTRVGVSQDTLAIGDRLVLSGNPRRDFDDSGVMNFKAVQRPRDGWSFPPR